MANTFKLKTSGSIGTGSVKVYTVPSSTTTVLIGATLANTSNASIGGSLLLESDTSDTEVNNNVYIVKDAPIPAGSSLEVMAGNKLVVQGNGTANDVVRVEAGTAAALDATISVLEDV